MILLSLYATYEQPFAGNVVQIRESIVMKKNMLNLI